MRNKIAKKIRKEVYGDTDFRERKYSQTNFRRGLTPEGKIITTSTFVADDKRRIYQNAKKIRTRRGK